MALKVNSANVTREQVYALLNNYHYLKIKFRKVSDYKLRTMLVTTSEAILKDKSVKSESGLVDTTTSIIKVFSLEDNGWRSFIIDNLVEIEGV